MAIARIRSVKPEFFSDLKMSKVSRDARLLFIGMWNFSDDRGVIQAHPVYLRNTIFPYDDIDVAIFAVWLEGLEGIGVICRFEAHGETYYHIKNFNKHQRVDKPNYARCNPPPPTFDEVSTKDHRNIVDASLTERIGGDRDKDRDRDKENYILSSDDDCVPVENIIHDVIAYLNQKTGKYFSVKTKETMRHINARVAEGRSLEDFKRVIDIKVSKWAGDPKMADFLRPQTLFGTKFESYLNEKPARSRVEDLREVGESWLSDQRVRTPNS